MGCFTKILPIHIICYKLFVRCIFAILLFWCFDRYIEIGFLYTIFYICIRMYIIIYVDNSLTFNFIYKSVDFLCGVLKCIKSAYTHYRILEKWKIVSLFDHFGWVYSCLEAIDWRLFIFAKFIANLYVYFFLLQINCLPV